ncbi:MAG TPA: maleylpyruvate isomerase N-terminal domain-containing protein [Terriglobales bacterium]|nr:maleylpyruvate isomerase N-terminal domain-containing protein [Terriglobales bacterium]
MNTLKPIFTVELFPLLEDKLIELLRCLRHDEWSRPTLAKQWTVKDVAAHLLDGNIKRLSIQRDGFLGLSAPPIDGYESLVAFINRNNAEWVQSARRISPRILIDWLEITSKEVSDFFRTLDPFAPALWSVAWAGEDQSANWFDIAREYTERWHHQQQIRVAVDRPGITSRQLYFPVLDTFMRGLPHAFRSVAVPYGTAIEVRIIGEAGGSWWIENLESGWQLCPQPDRVQAAISIDQQLAWQIFTKAVDAKTAAEQTQISGDRSLALRVLSLVAVLA